MPRVSLPLIAALLTLPCGCSPEDSAKAGAGARSSDADITQQDEEKESSTLVRVGRLRRGAIDSSIEVSTDIEAEFIVSVYAKVGPAYVKEMIRREGDQVSVGDPLVLLDDIDFRIAVRRQESRLLQSKLTQTLRKTSLAESQARLRAQQAIEARSRADFERAENAMKGEIDVLSAKELNDARTNWEQAVAELEATSLAVQRAGSDLELAVLEEQATEIELEAAQNDLEQTIVRSTIDGVIQQRHINAGLLVNSSNLLYTITDPFRLIASLRIPQEDLQVVSRIGLPVEFRLDALPGQVFLGEVEAINPSIDPSSGLVKVRARLAKEAGGRILPGMFARARIIVESRDNAYLLSKRAVVYEENLTFFFAEEEGRARRHSFEAGASTENEVEVVGVDGTPLALDDATTASRVEALNIIMVGQDRLRDGDPVKLAGDSS